MAKRAYTTRDREAFHVMLDPDVSAALTKWREQTGVSRANAIRTAIRAYLIDQGFLKASKKEGR